MTETIKISIANDFSPRPGLRYRRDGDNSAEDFFDRILKPALEKIWDIDGATVVLSLDGVYGYASSFLSELGLRLGKTYTDHDKLKNKLNIIYEAEPYLVKFITEAYNNCDNDSGNL